MNLIETIRLKLAVLEPISIDIKDDSVVHAGHKGSNGGGHFSIKVVSSHFSQKTQLMRHRLIYQALSELIPQHIHAISISAVSPTDTN